MDKRLNLISFLRLISTNVSLGSWQVPLLLLLLLLISSPPYDLLSFYRFIHIKRERERGGERFHCHNHHLLNSSALYVYIGISCFYLSFLCQLFIFFVYACGCLSFPTSQVDNKMNLSHKCHVFICVCPSSFLHCLPVSSFIPSYFLYMLVVA